MTFTRRDFIKTSALAAGTGLAFRSSPAFPQPEKLSGKSITITDAGSDFEREPLIRPFGFKGGYMREIWQTVARLKIKGIFMPSAHYEEMFSG